MGSLNFFLEIGFFCYITLARFIEQRLLEFRKSIGAWRSFLLSKLRENLMKIAVNNKRKKLTRGAVERAMEKIAKDFSKFKNRIVSIELTAVDANGPQGGVDKECRLLVRLRKMEDVIAIVKEETFSKAIAGVIYRAQRSVVKKIRKRSSGRNSNRVPAFRFALNR